MKVTRPSSGRAARVAAVVAGALCALLSFFARPAAAQSSCFIRTPVGPGDNEALAVALQPDGRIVVAGYSLGGTDDDFTLVRYNADLSLDTTFGGTGIVVTPVGFGTDHARAVAIQPDGKIVVAGFAFNGSDDDFAVVRYLPDGTLDGTFGSGGIFTQSIGVLDRAHGVAIQSDGKIVVAGQAFLADEDFAAIRLNVDGTLDLTFDGDGIVTTSIGPSRDIARDVAVQLDGKIVLGGNSRNLTDTDVAVVRYNADGSLDISFDTDGVVVTAVGAGDDEAHALALQPDGKIVLAGSYDAGGDFDWLVVRYHPDGSLDTSFDGDGIATTTIGTNLDWATDVVIYPDDDIVVAGYTDSGANLDVALARFRTNGSLDTSFDGDGIVTTPLLSGDDRGYGITIEADGRFLVVGSTDGTNLDHAIIRYENDGSLSCNQISVHPTSPGSINAFSFASGCASGNWDCVNDQPGNAGVGTAVANDGLTSYVRDNDGQTNREMFALDDGTVPLGAIITEIQIRAQVGSGAGPSPGMRLSYQRVGWDGAPVDGSLFTMGVACCSGSVSWNVTGLKWSTAELDALEIGLVHVSGGELFVSQIYVTVTYLLPPTPQTYLRSIGTRPDYGTGGPEGAGTTVAATYGSNVIAGSGTAWLSSNRGRGDRIHIDGVDYTVLSVDAEDVITLTTPFAGTSASGKAYTISRQFTTLGAWEACISGAAACPYFPVASSSLVTDNRSEIGIAYKDSIFTPAGVVLFDGATTDADHTITLTADGRNRHHGIAGAGVVVDGQDGINGIEVRDDHVTIEWLEIIRVRGGFNAASIEIGGPDPVTGTLLRQVLIHDYDDPTNDVAGIRLSGGASKEVSIQNVMIWDGDRYGIEGDAPLDTMAIDNVSIEGIADIGGVGIDAKASVVTVRNAVVAASTGSDFIGPFAAASSNNTSSDGSAPGASPQTGILASDLFVAPGFDLHLKSGANPAVDTGFDLSSGFTRDIDGDFRGAPWDRGADERDSLPFRIHYRSIGTNASDLKTGLPTVTMTSGVAVFSAAQTGDVGIGDQIAYDGGTIAYITSRVSATEFTVVTAAGNSPPNVAGALVDSIRRAYNSLQDWESDREGDLVSENRREVGVVYNDGVFTAGVSISGSVTDAQRFLKLMAAPHHRHLGKEGGGVAIDGLGTGAGQIDIRNDYTVVEWLEVRNTLAPASAAVLVRDARSVMLSHLLIHDSVEGVRLSGGGGNDFTIRNSILYHNQDDGIAGDEITDTIVVENCTLFANGDNGVEDALDTTFYITNTISVANGNQDFDMAVGTQSHNISSDGTAFGPGSLTFRIPTDVPNPGPGNWVIFASLAAGAEDFHLQASVENDAIDAAIDLSPSFWDDVDGTSRTALWDVGADELGVPFAGVLLSSSANQSFVVGSPPVTAMSISIVESALGGNITAADDLRLRIPAGFAMRWDTSVTTVTLSGGAAGKVETKVLAYEDGARTLVLDVNADFVGSEDVIVDDLAFRSFTAPSSLDHLELEVRNDGIVSALDDKTIVINTGSTATISSDADQVFTDGDPPTVASPITVSEGTAPTMAPGSDIRIVIPAGLSMTWDAGFLNPTFSGPGASKVDPTVSYSGGDTVLVITVTAPFVTGDYLVISDVVFENFTGPTMGSLELVVGTALEDVDDKVISILTTGSVEVLTATSTTTQNHLEWVNPNDPSYIHTRILAREDGVFPTDPLDLGSARLVVDHFGMMGEKASFDDTGLDDDKTYYYTAFVYDGTSYSAGVETTGRPFDNLSGDMRWAYSTGATAMAPPALRFETPTTTFIYAVSNDSILHSMNGSGSATPGEWPTNWKPYRLGGIAQQRPPVVPFAIGAATNGAVFVGSQDGTVYAIDADTGSLEWQSAPVGNMLTASPAGMFTDYGAPFNFLVIGTRNSTPPNFFSGLDPFDGSIDWTFDNSGAQGGDNTLMGIISGGATVQYQDPGDGSRHFFFAARAAGSPDTVWCVKWDGTGVSLVWSSDLPAISGSPNIDGSPIRFDLYGGRIYVGTNGGEVVALDAATGNVEWVFDTADGPVKGFLFPQFGTTNLFLSTTNKVWSLSDDGGSVSVNPNWPASVPNPSTPLVVPSSTHVLVGSSDGQLYQLDVGDPALFVTEKLGDGNGGVGMPTIDLYNSTIYVGTEQGVIYAIDYPIVP